MNAMETYSVLSRPPASALRKIEGGRLSGKTDINPQWRIRAMTEHFGLCGIGWKMSIDRTWTEPGTEGQVFAWAQVSVYIKDGDKWSEPVQGVGGNFLIEKERNGLHDNDEGFKMAITDALGTALKMIGVAADIYAGKWDGTKYRNDPPEQITGGYITPKNANSLPPAGDLKIRAKELADSLGLTLEDRKSLSALANGDYAQIVKALEGMVENRKTA